MMWWEYFKTACVMSRNVFMSVPSLEPIKLVLWKIITKHSEMDKKNKILLFKAVALYMWTKQSVSRKLVSQVKLVYAVA